MVNWKQDVASIPHYLLQHFASKN